MSKRKPDFENILQVLRRERPSRPTPFELLIGDHVLEFATGEKAPDPSDGDAYNDFVMRGFFAAGYDFATVRASDFLFPGVNPHEGHTISQSQGLIEDEESFERFVWPNPEDFPSERLGEMSKRLPEGGKLAVMGPGGVLENVMTLVGFENLCVLLYTEPELLKRIFDEVGRRILAYYEPAVEYDGVGLLIANDDWGYNTQTFLRPSDIEEYIFPWHRKYVELAHSHGLPIVLHSCGQLSPVMDSIAGDLGYDGKHSYEDVIVPVEEAYRRWHDKIAIIGGIDVNFLANSSDEAIRARCRAMLELAEQDGGYALGAGNSVPDYVPVRAWQAMMSAL